MKKVLPVLGDVGLGLLTILMVSLAYGEWSGWAYLLLPLALLPDLDAVPELVQRGKVAASSEHPHDHREVLHRPFLWLLPLGALWYVGGYYGAVAFWLVFVHFLHDSVLTGWGVAWFSPFSNIHIKFFVNERNEESLRVKDWVRTWDEASLNKAIVAFGNENWIDDLYLRLTPVSFIEYTLFGLGLLWTPILRTFH